MDEFGLRGKVLTERATGHRRKTDETEGQESKIHFQKAEKQRASTTRRRTRGRGRARSPAHLGRTNESWRSSKRKKNRRDGFLKLHK